MGVAPIFALSFFGNDLGKTLIRGATGSSELNAFQLGLAGGFSGILTTAIMAPGERIKCILQVRKLRIPTFRVEYYIEGVVRLFFPPFFFAFFDIANKKSLIEFLLRFEIFKFFRQLLSRKV